MEKNWDIINTALRSQPSVAVRNPEGGYDGPDDYRNYYVTNPGTIMPRLSTESAVNKNNRVSDAYVEDGSYIPHHASTRLV